MTDRDIKANIHIKDFEEVLESYKDMKYAEMEIDYEHVPEENKIANELLKDISFQLESNIKIDINTFLISYKSRDYDFTRMIDFEYAVNELTENEADITIKVVEISNTIQQKSIN